MSFFKTDYNNTVLQNSKILNKCKLENRKNIAARRLKIVRIVLFKVRNDVDFLICDCSMFIPHSIVWPRQLISTEPQCGSGRLSKALICWWITILCSLRLKDQQFWRLYALEITINSSSTVQSELTEEVTGGLIEGYFDVITYCCKPVTDPQVRRTRTL